MEGSMHLIDLVSHNVVQKLFDFHKFIVKIIWSPNGRWVAAVAYDKQVIIYEVVETAAEQMENALLDGEEADELATTPKIELVQRLIRPVRTNPESAVFLPDSSSLVYSAREDHLLHYVRLPGPNPSSDDWALSTINLNENGDAWVSFSMYVPPLPPPLILTLPSDCT
jgi:WD40 repeat protein